MLPITTFRRLFAEHFPEQPESVIFVPVDKREAWLKELANRLVKKRRVSCFLSRRNKQVAESAYLGIQIAGVGNEANSGDYLNLLFENRNETYGLWVVEYGRRKSRTVRPDGAVSDTDQLDALIDQILVEQERRNLKHKRRDKMDGLKQTSLTARLKKLGKEHNFAFAIGESKRNVNLSVRVNGRKTGFHFTFPKGRLDKVLETLPELIAMLERMQKLGIAFHRKNKHWERKIGEWIEPEPVDEDEKK